MSPTTLTIHTDQGPMSLPVGSTLADAVAQLLAGRSRDPAATATVTVTADTIATAVNGEFVARAARAHHTLHDGDTVLCFSPITGG